MAKQWYVVHTYSGYENRAKQSLEERIKTLGQEEFFETVLVPTEDVVEMVKGQKRTSKRKFFPGYMLVKMELTDETWYVVKSTPKVTGFVGGRSKPTPIPEEEVLFITNQMNEGAIRPKLKVTFDKGESVRIIDGPFSNFTGIVEEVNPEKGKVRVSVSIFGRSTPVELELVQVEKS